MLNELTNLLGLPINAPEVKSFVEKNNLKYPKKEIYSIHSDPDPVLIRGKKIGKKLIGVIKCDEYEFELIFEAKRWNPKYIETPAERAGSFYYMLNTIEIGSNTNMELELLSMLNIPSREVNKEELFTILGKREENRYESYSWLVPLNEEKDICVNIHYIQDCGISVALVIPIRPLISESLCAEFGEVLGRPINSPEVKAFIEKYHGIYPKKDTIDASIDPSTVIAYVKNETEGQYYQVFVAGGSIVLRFGLKEKTEKYFPVPAKKANHYYPILNEISLSNFYSFIHQREDTIVNFPLGVKSDDSLDTIIKKWGKPLRGSEKDDYCDWEVPIDKDGDFVMDIFYQLKDGFSHFNGMNLDFKLLC